MTSENNENNTWFQDDLTKDQIARKYFTSIYSNGRLKQSIINKKVLYFTVLKKAFDAFDHDKKGSIGTDMVGTILTMLGYELSEKTLKEIITEVDEDGKNIYRYLNFIIQ